FDLGEDVVICPGDSVFLVAPATTDLITWQDGSHGASFVASQEQVYELQISNDCGVASDEAVVSFDQDVPILDLGPILSICPEQSVTLDVTQSFDASYLWNTGSTLPSIVITQPDLYAVTVSTECYSISDDILIETNDCVDHEIFIPNIFSPNGDNVNDHWEVHITDPNVMRVKCRIFDRWGNLLFETYEIPITWNGRFGERELNPGVYVYLIIVEKQAGPSDVLSGDVTLIR
ncbi:MAG TPA: gliding motility-associated C-terminal domain-containing protein, partial [Saprospiraceae bacterium]|nr:gliding motility-associated C-terminal domain-containing protein [Saprospiraceae bacterium]